MPKIHLCFVWHMHQPFYKDLGSGEYQLPWTRMHALKDYYGMVQVLEEFPQVHQTFNLVPSMMVQIEEYAAGKAQDPFLRCALKPAEDLTPQEQTFILKYFFQANPARMIYRYPRYGELYEMWRAGSGDPDTLRRRFTAQAFRDLQVLSQLAWFDEIIQEKDPDVKALLRKGRDYSLEDQELMGRKQVEICGMVLPVYREFAATGQIELSVTPFYHPILPLLCDSNIASVSHPNVPLPRRFHYPQDARYQIAAARKYAKEELGFTPAGMWPSEGSVSDETLTIAADEGVKWMATDNGVLGATLMRAAGVEETYRPYVWRQSGREMHMIFRDHFLSDLIGFVYSKMGPVEAADHFLDRIRENCRGFVQSGRDALVPVILDGENAWEHFDRNGREFLRSLYRKITDDPQMEALTVQEALQRIPSTELTRIHPGSWINANYDVWIGAEEDNRAWNLLLDARETYDRVLQSPLAAQITPEKRKLAFEELLIAEGSDWNWWYGPEHHSDNREEFDKLFREHLAQVYRALGLPSPEELSRPILRLEVEAYQEAPAGSISPKIDGQVTSYFEWLGAGLYRPDQRQGAMHGQQFVVKELYYGGDGENAYLRLDFHPKALESLPGTEVRISVESGGRDLLFSAHLTPDRVMPVCAAESADAILCAYKRIFEISLDLGAAKLPTDQPLRVQVSVWKDGLPVEAIPTQGWLEFAPGLVDSWAQ